MDIRRACERVWSLYNMEGIKMKPGVNMCTITGDIPDFTVIIIRSEQPSFNKICLEGMLDMKELGWKSGKAVRILYTPYLCGVLDSARLTFVSKMLATAALLADVINDAIPKNTTALAADGHVLSEARQVDNVDVFYGASYPFRFEIVAAVECLKSFGCDHAYIRYWFLTHTLLYIYSKNPHQDCIRVLQMDELTKAYHASLEWDIEHYRHVATSMVRKSVERMSAPSDNQALEVPPVPAELIVANLDAIMEIMPDLYAWRGRE